MDKIDKKTYAEMENKISEKWQQYVSNNNMNPEHDTILLTAGK
ncbi:MAG TPA: hypothetical protein PKA90_15985 [Ignavibacteria bacterium]|nr:hypothetical protein [Ignavibacteria bacterium]HMR41917.1 hypothetical protein [Ignavibacteria bacterium]